MPPAVAPARRLMRLPSEPDPRLAGWLAPGFNCTALQYAIVRRAMLDDGIRERPWGSNRGVRIDRYTKRAGLPVPKDPTAPGWYWCALWVGCVFADCGVPVPEGFPACDAWLPYVEPNPAPGAAILYGVPGDARHIGIVADLTTDAMLTVEGNRGYGGSKTNNGVAVDLAPTWRADVLGYVHPETLVRRAAA